MPRTRQHNGPQTSSTRRSRREIRRPVLRTWNQVGSAPHRGGLVRRGIDTGAGDPRQGSIQGGARVSYRWPRSGIWLRPRMDPSGTREARTLADYLRRALGAGRCGGVVSSARMLGRVIGVSMSAVITLAGWLLVTNTPPLSGGHIAGVLVMSAGAGLLVRIVHVAQTEGR